MTGRHPATEQLLGFFVYDHLPPHLSAVSKAFSDLANDMVLALPDSPELTAGLRKLLEAKDCAVRATVAAVAASDTDQGPC